MFSWVMRELLLWMNHIFQLYYILDIFWVDIVWQMGDTMNKKKCNQLQSQVTVVSWYRWMGVGMWGQLIFFKARLTFYDILYYDYENFASVNLRTVAENVKENPLYSTLWSLINLNQTTPSSNSIGSGMKVPDKVPRALATALFRPTP